MSKRYSLLINISKLSIITIIVFLCIFLWILTQDKNKTNESLNENLPAEITTLSKNVLKIKNYNPETEISVDNLTFTSKTQKNEPYHIIAKQATKTKDGSYNLKNIKADVNLKNRDMINLTASKGDFAENTQLLHLKQNIQGVLNGYNLYASEVFMNLSTNEVKTNNKVFLHNKNIEINSNQLKYNGNEKLLLQGDVKTVINLGNNK